MRLVLALALLAGCHARDHGPAWPKRADRGSDGGESLAPHLSSSIATATDDDDATVEDKPAAEKPSAATVPTVTAPKVPTATPIDESLFGDDLTIEVDD